MKTISKTGESAILNYIEDNFSIQKDERLLIGPGDDAAVLGTESGKVLVATTDEMVEGTHFKKGFLNPDKIAKKLLRINLSDLAAMGNVRPLTCLAGGGLPKNTPSIWIKKFTKTLSEEAAKFGLSLAGGNLAKSDNLHVYLTVLGEAKKDGIIKRSGARAGDFLYSLGYLGDAKAGLEIFLRGKISKSLVEKKLLGRFWLPEPMLKAGRLLGKHNAATCMLDNSDGLLRSAEIISRASKCRVVVAVQESDLSKELRKYFSAKKKKALDYAIGGGEDYGLVFAANPVNQKKIKKLLPEARVIGRIEKGKGVCFENNGKKIESFEHF